MFITNTANTDMKRQLNIPKKGFISGALLWAVLLYACSSCIIYWNDITRGHNNEPVVYNTNTDNDIRTATVSLDSLQKHIHVADNIIYYLRAALHY